MNILKNISKKEIKRELDNTKENLKIQMNNNKMLMKELGIERQENKELQLENLKLKDEIKDLKKNVKEAYDKLENKEEKPKKTTKKTKKEVEK